MNLIRFLKKIIGVNLELLGIKKIDKKDDLLNFKFSGTRVAGKIELIKIGENVSFGGDVLLYANASIEIGDNTMIAHHVMFHTSTHDYNDHPMWTKRIDKPIKIGKHVWIGTGAIIIPGIIIEDYAVVGAGSLVTSNVPEGAIVAGNPARIIKYRDKSTYLKVPEIINSNQISIVLEGFSNKYCR